MPSARTSGLVCTFCGLFAALNAADWPHWRGPGHDGISSETIPSDLPAALPVLWQTNVGIGFATVSVRGHDVVTMGHRDDRDTITCLEAATGRVRWQHSYACALDPHLYEGGPSSTPTIHGDSVYALSKKGHAFRLRLATGEVIWKRDLVAELAVEIPEWSFASSPFIDGDQVLLNVGRGGLALATATGATRWLAGTGTAGYATVVPLADTSSGATHLLFSAKSLLGFEARTGRKVWEHPALASRDVNAADPLVLGRRVLFSSSTGTKLVEIAPDGGVLPLWEERNMKWYFNAGVRIGDHVYSMHGTTHRPTELMCTHFETGRIVWKEAGFRSGALMAAGRTLIIFDSGRLTLGEASQSGFRPRLQQPVLSGKCWTVPVLAHGRIYCRNAAGDLACLQLPNAP